MKKRTMRNTLVLLAFAGAWTFAQPSRSVAIPTIITNHYGESEIKSHGLITVEPDAEKIVVAVRDLTKGREYRVVLLNEMTGARSPIGTFKAEAKGGAKTEFNAKGLLKEYNALLIMYDEDVIQYAQLQESHHGCICKHSGGTIVTRRLDQECYECPCGVKYEICCGGTKKN